MAHPIDTTRLCTDDADKNAWASVLDAAAVFQGKNSAIELARAAEEAVRNIFGCGARVELATCVAARAGGADIAGGANTRVAVLPAERGPEIVVTLARTQRDFSESDEDVLHALVQHLQRALQRLERLRCLRAELRSALQMHVGGSRRRPNRDRIVALLTRRQGEIALLVCKGCSNREIADLLGVSPRTVEKHLEAIFERLGVENRFQLIVEVRLETAQSRRRERTRR